MSQTVDCQQFQPRMSWIPKSGSSHPLVSSCSSSQSNSRPNPALSIPVSSSSSDHDHNCNVGTSKSKNLKRSEEEAFGDSTSVGERAERAQCRTRLNPYDERERHERYSKTAQSERERNMAAHKIFECCRSAIKLPCPQLDLVAFKKVLEYIVSNTFTMSGSTSKEIFDILQASSLFGLADLGTLCRTSLRLQIDSDNVVETFHLAKERNDKILEELTSNHISSHIKEVFSSPRFLELSKDALYSLLNLDKWCLEEVEVFGHVKRWASSKVLQSGRVNSGEQMKTTLGQAFFAIRFPLMTEDEFYDQVLVEEHKGLFSIEESQELCKYFHNLRRNLNTNCVKLFVSRPRLHQTLPLSSAAVDDNAEVISSKINIDSSGDTIEVEDEQLSDGDLVNNVSLSSVSFIHEDPEPVTPPKKSRIENPRWVGTKQSEDCTTVQKYVNALEKRNDRENIKVIDKTLRFYALPHNRVYLPNLAEFRLRLKLNQSLEGGSDFRDYVCEKTKGLDRLLFFNKAPPNVCKFSSNSENNLIKLLRQKVNISIHVEGCLILKVDHGEGELSMNMLACAQEIIDSLNNFPLKMLAINYCAWSSLEGLRQDLLHTVVINGMEDLEDIAEFFDTCSFLREIACDSTFSETEGKLISLQHILNRNEHLEKMSFSDRTLSFLANPRPRGRHSSLRELYLGLSNYAYVLGSFGSYPKLNRVCLRDGKAESLLFYDIMTIESLEWIFVEGITMNRSEDNDISVEARIVHNFLSKVFNSDTKLVSDWPTFTLEKKTSQREVQPGTSKSIIFAPQKYDPFDASKWKGVKITDEGRNSIVSELNYKHFSYNQFYPDCETFVNIQQVEEEEEGN